MSISSSLNAGIAGLAANAYQSRLDGDAKLRSELGKLSRSRQEGVLDVLADRNVQQTAASTRLVTSTIGNVGAAADDAGKTAGEVLTAAGQVSEQAEALSREMTRFLGTVRAA